MVARAACPKDECSMAKRRVLFVCRQAVIELPAPTSPHCLNGAGSSPALVFILSCAASFARHQVSDSTVITHNGVSGPLHTLPEFKRRLKTIIEASLISSAAVEQRLLCFRRARVSFDAMAQWRALRSWCSCEIWVLSSDCSFFFFPPREGWRRVVL